MMTSCSREESKAASKGNFSSRPSDTILPGAPVELDQWYQAGHGGASELPLSPPDTASTCTFTDFDDMWARSINSDSEWMASQAQPDEGFEVHSSEHTWSYFENPAPSTQAIEHTPWIDGTSGPVEFGLSPVLSYDESHNSRSLTSFPASDVSSIPPGLDLSFIEPTWRGNGPAVVTGSCQEENTAGLMDPDSQGINRQLLCDTWVANAPCLSPQAGVSVPDLHPAKDQHYYGPANLALPRGQIGGNMGESQSVLGSPPLQTTSFQNVPEWTSTTAIPPNMPSAHATGPYVDQLVPLSHSFDIAAASPTATASNGPRRYVSLAPNPSHDISVSRRFSGETRPASSFGGGEAIEAFDHPPTDPRDVRVLSPVSPSNVHAYPREVHSVTSSHPPMESLPYATHLNLRLSGSEHPSGHENDEGRHRTDPLYAKGPQADGLYHCPYVSETNCQHKPTKLKCNYDKFIDSHLKPFRCKNQNCSKLAFSSTACLLRHEREAHGMHGHGERPHLCRYANCERSNPGNGFPRRYNLYDHMKRVHNFRAVKGLEHVTGEDRKSGSSGRKRKEAASAGAESPAKVVKMDTGLVSPPMAQADVAHVFTSSEYGRRSQHEQNLIYSQWESQRELLARQLGSVQSPQDEANLERLSRDIAELRRLSEEARQN